MAIRTLALIRANLEKPGNGPGPDLDHLARLVRALVRADAVDAVALALPDDAFHRRIEPSDWECGVFLGHAGNMNIRMAQAVEALGADTVVDCSLLTRCTDPALYDEILASHAMAGDVLTEPHLWRIEYLPRIVAAETLAAVAAEHPWPYYKHIPESGIHRFVPDVNRYARMLDALNPLCRELACQKARAGTGISSHNLTPYDPERWLFRCRNLLAEMEKLFGRRDLSVLEIGCGRRFGLGLLLCMAGVARYAGIDVERYPATEEKAAVFEEFLRLRAGSADVPGLRFGPVQWDAELKDGDSFLGGRVQHRAMSACAMDFPEAEFDYIFSDAVLEHVDDAATAAREMYRVLKPGGLALHRIGFNDHIDPTKRGVSHIFQSRESWRLKTGIAYLNLLRPNDFYGLFRDAGFTLVEIQEAKDFSIDTAAAHPDHARHGASDLQTLKCHVLLRKD